MDNWIDEADLVNSNKESERESPDPLDLYGCGRENADPARRQCPTTVNTKGDKVVDDGHRGR